MRIRKRLPPQSQIAADPSPRSQASNGREEPQEESGRGGLHPDGDLPADPNGCWSWRSPTPTRVLQDRPPSDPNPTILVASPPASHLNGCCIHSSHPINLQVLRDDEKMELDLHKTWDAQVNSNMSNIGAQISGATVIIEETAIGGIEGEKAKKRRGGYETGDEKQMGKVKVRAKVSTAPKGNSTSIGISSIKNKNSDDVGAKMENGKKRRSTGMLMEGSRCSRVNGRGWRCCQQTLVGYSLCEHHLGKGRLRSVSSMRGEVSGSKPNNGAIEGDQSLVVLLPQELEKKQEQQQYSGVDYNGRDEENNVEEEKEKEETPLMKRRKKIGMVKARSISSLLSESNR